MASRKGISIDRLILALCAAAVFLGSSGQAEMIRGPVEAALVSVVDGDTIRVRVRIWLDQEVETLVRLSGIDAPEIRGACAEERALAAAARERLAARLAGASIVLTDIEHGKYAGRVVARVISDGGEDIGQSLVREGLAHPYDGGTRRSWCAPAHADK